MDEQPPISVDPERVIAALENKLTRANREIVMLEALANQQQEQINSMLGMLAELEAAKGSDTVPEQNGKKEKSNA